SRQDERQRLDRRNVIIEFHHFHESQRRDMRYDRPRTCTLRELVGFDAFLSQPLPDLYSRKICKCAKRAGAPSLVRLRNFRWWLQHIDRESTHSRGFRSSLNNRHSTETTRRADRCIGIRCYRDICLESTRAYGIANLPRDFRISAEQPLQSLDIKDHRPGARVFDTGRERPRTIDDRPAGIPTYIANVHPPDHNFSDT